MSFMREAPGIRLAETRYGDTLQRIALRELGDASRWVELAELNGLRPPYLAESSTSGSKILAYGATIKIPSPSSQVSAAADPEGAYGVDLVLDGKHFVAENGDIALVSGVKNLSQALRHRVTVGKRELGFHPDFGCHVREMLGASNAPASSQLAAFYVRSALLEDERVSEVSSCIAELMGDQIRVVAKIVPVSGVPIEMLVVV